MSKESVDEGNPWKTFDGIYCINLRERTDRRKLCQDIFDKHKIPVEFHTVERDPLGGLRGCFISHRDIARKAYHDGKQRIVIFEDDIGINPSASDTTVWRSVETFMNSHRWEFFYLGTHPEIKRHRVKYISKHIIALHSICTHAYCLSREGMKRMAAWEFDGTAIDKLLVDREVYGVYPSMFHQNNMGSDISNNWHNSIPLKPYWFSVLDWYSYNVNVPVMEWQGFVGVLLLLVLIILVFYMVR